MESAKITGQKISLKELDKYGQVNLRSSKVSKSLIQDGGKLKPIKSTEAKTIAQNGGLNTRSRHALPSLGGNSSNRSRLVIRDNAMGTTEVISKTPSKPKMITASLRNAKASLDGKLKKNKNMEASSNGTPLGIMQS